MIQCPTCGTTVADGTQICPRCGNSISGYGSQSQTVPYANNAVPTGSYAGTPTYQSPARNPYRILSLVLGVLLVGVSVVLVILLLRISGSSAIKAGMTPRQTIEALNTLGKDLYDKLNNDKLGAGDIQTAYNTVLDVIPKDVQNELTRRMKKEMNRGGGYPKIEVVDEKVDGDKATVRIHIHQEREGMPPMDETSPDIPMIKEDGKWKFDLMKELPPDRF